MIKVLRLVEKNKRDECMLFSSEVPDQPGLYAASVVYWQRSEQESVPAHQHFPSTTSVEDTEGLAKTWVAQNLFSEYDEVRLSESS